MQACVLKKQRSTTVRGVRSNMLVASSLQICLLYPEASTALASSSQESLIQTEPLAPLHKQQWALTFSGLPKFTSVSLRFCVTEELNRNKSGRNKKQTVLMSLYDAEYGNTGRHRAVVYVWMHFLICSVSDMSEPTKPQHHQSDPLVRKPSCGYTELTSLYSAFYHSNHIWKMCVCVCVCVCVGGGGGGGARRT